MSNFGDYDEVIPGSLEDYPPTPDVLQDPDFRGIMISGPDEVPLEGSPGPYGGFARMIVCGAMHIDSNYFGLREDFLDHVFFVAVNARTHQPYISRLAGLPNALPMPDPFGGLELTQADWTGRSVILFFNENLVTTLGIPEVPADYVVYAALGGYVSNVLRMRLA